VDAPGGKGPGCCHLVLSARARVRRGHRHQVPIEMVKGVLTDSLILVRHLVEPFGHLAHVAVKPLDRCAGPLAGLPVRR
jgi:hypothetical protein